MPSLILVPLFDFIFGNVPPLAFVAFEIVARLARTMLRLVCGAFVQLASIWWKILYFITFVWLTTQPLLSTINTAFGPLCSVPGIASTRLCSDLEHHNFQLRPLWADFPRLMNAQTLTFEQLLDNSVGGSGLSLDIKKAEMAMSDLVVLIKFSELSSKDVLSL